MARHITKYRHKQLVAKFWLQQGGLCCYCNRQMILIDYGGEFNHLLATIDHKHAISRGGAKKKEKNLILCCQECNTKKGSKHYDKFIVDEKKYLVKSIQLMETFTC